MKFVDEAKITVRSGKGGNGAVSFRREKFIPKGGPDGGDGAKGGDVYLRASDKLLTLYDFRHKRLHEAKSGQGGMGSQMNGRAGDDLYVDVPVGTLVWQDGPTRLVGHQGYLAAATVGADGRPVDDDEDENEERDPFQPPKFKQFWDMDKDPDWDAVPDRAEETGSGEDTPPAAPLLLADLGAARATPTSRPRPGAPPASPSPASRPRRRSCAWSCGSWPTSACWACPMPASRPSCPPCPRPGPRSRPTPSPPCPPTSGCSRTTPAGGWSWPTSPA
jgi:hypothetical protein